MNRILDKSGRYITPGAIVDEVIAALKRQRQPATIERLARVTQRTPIQIAVVAEHDNRLRIHHTARRTIHRATVALA